jgi:copper chaperone CopZ
MIRRKFLSLATLAGVGGLAAIEGIASTERKTVTFRVSGFTCITCAVGLETLLEKERGVIHAKASYPENVTTITYNPAQTSEAALADFIATAGFKAIKSV